VKWPRVFICIKQIEFWVFNNPFQNQRKAFTA
jgi:hypothetical protein